MDALAALRTRRSIRRYKPDPVPRQLIEQALDCARLAATANNLQPWEFVVVTDAARRKDIAAMTDHGKFIADAPVCVVILCKETKYYLEDGSAAIQNLLVAAHALGLGACWIAGDKKACAATLPGLLGAPASTKLVGLVALGFPAENPAPRKRPLTELVHWDKY